ncbi:hypothetical protein [Antarcticirhabdus aurantiaca]|uniref:Uncharacterized protein n=1 Tax=Antarcticirhabdus aurantiaca TaxID=2606717 RepID=A0ACD4NM51_9HYPH|nr:hypothetical protein [Antarcticirhabdus aurantiaca]WAJ27785.1 hypothetical protein OXU80_23550 [Jeongeuplla avenae]
MLAASPFRILLLASAAVAVLATLPAASGGEAPIDLAGVTAVRITGESSEVRLSAGAAAPPRATFGSRRTGWFARWSSSWVGSACPDRASARIEGETLIVDVGAAGWLDLSDCVAEIDASLPAGASVVLDQPAASLNLDGDFGDVTVRARAADLSLDGHAATIAVESDAARTRIAFARVEGTEDVRLTGKAMDAQLSFPAGVPVSWRVTAAASFVDGRIPNTPGARPQVAIDGEFVRATIR